MGTENFTHHHMEETMNQFHFHSRLTQLTLACCLSLGFLFNGMAQAETLDTKTTTTSKDYTLSEDLYDSSTKVVPVLGAMRPPETVFSQVEKYDLLEQDAQRQMEAESVATGGSPSQAVIDAYTSAKAKLDAARYDAWSHIPYHSSMTLLMDAPLRLALLEWHILIRRQVGPVLHTLVPGLTTDPGCGGDLIADRLLYTYGRAATNYTTVVTDGSAPVKEALADVGRQVACLGSEQLARLDWAMLNAWTSLAGQMKAQGTPALVGPLARLLAPVEVLVLDARKHTGATAAAWQWFTANETSLNHTVGQAGWASKELLLWNRQRGGLYAFPLCASGQYGPTCVDIKTFLASLTDPRALGLGHCGLAGMVGRGIEFVDGDQRYLCPLRACGDDSTLESDSESTVDYTDLKTSSSTTPTPEEALQALYPGFDGSAFLGLSQFCRGEGEMLQGLTWDPQGCFTTNQENPYDTYASCVVDMGVGDDPQPIGEPLAGLPMGRECGLSDDNPIIFAVSAEEENFWNYVGSYKMPGGTTVLSYRKYASGRRYVWLDPNGNEIQNIFYYGSDFKSEVVYDEWGKNIGLEETERRCDENGVCTTKVNRFTETCDKGVCTKTWTDTKKVEKCDGAGNCQITSNTTTTTTQTCDEDGQCKETITKKTCDADGKCTTETPKTTGNQGSCDDPARCANSCTALGEQVGTMEACLDGLLDKIQEGATGSDTTDLTYLDLVSKPNPEEAQDQNIEMNMCLIDEGGATKPSLACGLQLCANGALSTGKEGTCGCGQDLFDPLKTVVNKCALTAYCPDGSIPTETCQCQPATMIEPTEPGGPDGPID